MSNAAKAQLLLFTPTRQILVSALFTNLTSVH